MTMPSTGPLNMGGTTSPVSVASELGLGLTSTISMNDSAVRTLAGVGGSGTTWSMNSLYGKSNAFGFTISTNQANADLRTLAINAGWNGSSAVIATVASGVYIYSTSVGTPGLTISGSFPGGVTLVNNGYIMGMGGQGNGYGYTAQAGGNAISLGVSCTITNNSYIGGGGGGGGHASNGAAAGGGGAGGGRGADAKNANNPVASGGAGGGVGANGSQGGTARFSTGIGETAAGGGGGRVMPGSNTGQPSALGNSSVGGFGGSGGGAGGATADGAAGRGYAGTGGGANNPGGTASYSGTGGKGGGGGGGWGASGSSGASPGNNTAGQAGGKAIALNGYTATLNGSGSTYGAVS